MSISKSFLALCLSWFLFHWKIGFAIASTYMAINSPVFSTILYGPYTMPHMEFTGNGNSPSKNMEANGNSMILFKIHAVVIGRE